MIRVITALLLALSLLACGADEPATPDTSPAGSSTASSSPPPADSSPAPRGIHDPCAMLTSAEIAAALGADPGSVTQEAGRAAEFGAGNNKDCNTTVIHEGVETTLTLLSRSRMENTPADAWAKVFEALLQNGEKIGSQNYVYEAAELGGAKALVSDVHGGAFVRIRRAVWRAGEELIYFLTVSTTLSGDAEGEPPVPSNELFASFIEAAMQ